MAIKTLAPGGKATQTTISYKVHVYQSLSLITSNIFPIHLICIAIKYIALLFH